MKKLMACLLLLVAAALSGCAGSYYRGVDGSGAFVSTVRPEVAVIPAAGFETVFSGSTLCLAKQGDAFMATIPVQVWYGLSAGTDRQLAVLLAECPAEWNWNVSSHGAEYQKYRLLREMRGADAGSPDLFVYIRPARQDAFSAALGQAAWAEDCLVARYEWLSSANHVKLVVDYREPATAAAEDLVMEPAAVSAFISRAQASFSRERLDSKENVQPGRSISARLPDSSLSAMLGSVVPVILFRGL